MLGGFTASGGSTLNNSATVNGGFTANGGGTIWSGTGTGNALTVGAGGSFLSSTAGARAGVSGTSSSLTSADGNTSISANNGSAVVSVVNTATGATHGLVVGTSSTTLSGGTNSTTMTLDNNGATFSNPATGGPAQVHGVANGTSTFDAVNVGQLNHLQTRMSGGIAATAALTMIPQVEPGKNFSIGAGGAGYGGQGGFAAGASMRFSENFTARAGIGIAPGSGGTQLVGGAGVAYSW